MARKTKSTRDRPLKARPVTAAARIGLWLENPNETNPDEREYNKARFGQRTRILNLSGLGLTELPEILRNRNFSHLENIDISNNNLESLPDWITELRELKGLNLSRNSLRELPQDLGKLSLRVLWLSGNQLMSLPDSIRSSPLKEIRLNGNSQLQLPSSILERPAQEILRYYFESRLEAGQPLSELKLLVVGRGKAGKTSLVKRLAGQTPSETESETHSISIREFPLNCPQGIVHTRAWDFGGQEILYSTHQFFLTERSLYLLVLEPRTGLAQRDAENWLRTIEVQSNNSPVIIALNWSHERPWRVDTVKLKRKFPFIAGFISTDAMFNEGIEDLRSILSSTVNEQMPDVWLPFPKHWREIKDAVANMKGNYLTFSQFESLCKKHAENRPDAQSDLAGILHALGLALYFGQDPRLHDTRVLNPGWVTGGVYAVIRSQLVSRSHGQLTTSDMPSVLAEAQEQSVISAHDYPPKTHSFILELMRAFQLCFASNQEDSNPIRFLVPELLPEFEPEMSESWEDAPLSLRYRYDALPPGILPRFIVRTHALSDDAPHWRHGVVLAHSDAKALVRVEADRSEVQMFVLGPDPDTRLILAAILRRELELLNKEIKAQPIEEMKLSSVAERWIGVRALFEVEQADRPVQRLPVQPEGTAEIDVAVELDKVLPSSARAIENKSSASPPPVRIFVSYAHDDERQLKRLDAILDVLEQQHGIEPWSDKRLIAGNDWDEEIRRRLEEMDIFLFIASQASLVRPYIRDPEIRRALERRKTDNIEILAVKLEPCAHDDDPTLGQIQRLGSKLKSIAEVSPKSLGWEQVRKDLLPVIERIRKRKQRSLSRDA